MCDITFIVGKECTAIPAHSLLVRARCPSLASLIEEEQKSSESTKRKKKLKKRSISVSFPSGTGTEIVLPDIPSSSAFEELLYFLYSGEVNTPWKFDLQTSFDLLSLATVYQQERLVCICERQIRCICFLPCYLLSPCFLLIPHILVF